MSRSSSALLSNPSSSTRFRTHSLDVAVVSPPFKSIDPPPRYQELGTFEFVAVIPEGHPLVELERVPRSELVKEPFLGWPRSMDPEMIDHLQGILFGSFEPPRTVEIPELGTRRFAHVANGEGIGVTILLLDQERYILGVVFRRFEEPTPILSFGVAWADTPVSPFVDAFLDVAREFADSEVPA